MQRFHLQAMLYNVLYMQLPDLLNDYKKKWEAQKHQEKKCADISYWFTHFLQYNNNKSIFILIPLPTFLKVQANSSSLILLAQDHPVYLL